jgi:hypothetical protein
MKHWLKRLFSRCPYCRRRFTIGYCNAFCELEGKSQRLLRFLNGGVPDKLRRKILGDLESQMSNPITAAEK